MPKIAWESLARSVWQHLQKRAEARQITLAGLELAGRLEDVGRARRRVGKGFRFAFMIAVAVCQFDPPMADRALSPS